MPAIFQTTHNESISDRSVTVCMEPECHVIRVRTEMNCRWIFYPVLHRSRAAYVNCMYFRFRGGWTAHIRIFVVIFIKVMLHVKKILSDFAFCLRVFDKIIKFSSHCSLCLLYFSDSFAVLCANWMKNKQRKIWVNVASWTRWNTFTCFSIRRSETIAECWLYIDLTSIEGHFEYKLNQLRHSSLVHSIRKSTVTAQQLASAKQQHNGIAAHLRLQ